MSSEAISDVAEVFLAVSMPTDPNTVDRAAERAIAFYASAPAVIALPEEEVTELVYVGFEPYLFMLYFELLTLETTDRFPGQAIYECGPRGQKVKALWNSMYHPTQENPYLKNAKSVYSLDIAWAETKFSRETQNGSLMFADIFNIMSELPYTTRRRIAHVIRCYLVHVANEKQASMPLPGITPTGTRSFVERVAASNSLTKGVLDQRLVDFLTMCAHEVAYVAHDISRLSRYKDGYAEEIGGIPFTFRFMTFYDLLDEAGGIELVAGQTELFDELVHRRISKLPDNYSLKQRYQELIVADAAINQRSN